MSEEEEEEEKGKTILQEKSNVHFVALWADYTVKTQVKTTH